MNEIRKLSAARLSQLLVEGEISSAEIAKALLDAMETDSSNCLLTVHREEALKQAVEIDNRRSVGDKSVPATAGLPIVLKDNIVMRGRSCTCASHILDGYVSPFDSHVVENLNRAGFVVLARANMDEFAMGSSNENSYYGAVKNPVNPEYVPGGSSGGSATSVALNLTPVALGSDTGGSIRQPAAFCGVIGLKPSYGRVSRYGLVAFGSSLDQIGPLARSVEDAALTLKVIAGHDNRDSTSVDEPVPDYQNMLDAEVKGLKVGLPKEYYPGSLNKEIKARVMAQAKALEALGAEIVEVSLPNTEYAIACYYIIATAEASANLARFDGVRYGYRSKKGGDLLDMYRNSRSEGFGAEVKRRIMLGTYVLSAGYYDAYYLKAQRVRTLIQRDFEKAFEKVDILLTPTAPSPAFKLGQLTDNPVEMYLQDIFTVTINLAGVPAVSIPAGTVNGLPVGAQLIGRPFDEPTLLKAAAKLEGGAR